MFIKRRRGGLPIKVSVQYEKDIMTDLTLNPFEGVPEKGLKKVLRDEARKMFGPRTPKKEAAFTGFILPCKPRKIVSGGVAQWRNIVGKIKNWDLNISL